ncbi:hypothetical protein NPIL_576151 [Nephila pilipes]|uniref:Uncharacterized protein n=1 Tax=Nephila pilipes TaxID=299642 RepID=A0A8X6THZ8_NEPPI|nr:hypothetical protein NPIL_576151 [Nephila pilipes]
MTAAINSNDGIVMVFIEFVIWLDGGLTNSYWIHFLRKYMPHKSCLTGIDKVWSPRLEKSESSSQMVEPVSIVEGEGDKGKLQSCLKSMFSEKERSRILETNLLPIIVIQGVSNTGKNYFMYYATSEAEKIGYKICCCCALETYRREPFMTIGLLIQRILDMSPDQSVREREQKILDAMPGGFDPQLYLFNHLFHVQVISPILPHVPVNISWFIEELAFNSSMP